jgi:glutamyl-tRNA reductase
VDQIKIIAFTHKTTPLVNIGKMHIDESERAARLESLSHIGIEEVVFLSTCNRVEIIFTDECELNTQRKAEIFEKLYPKWDIKSIHWAIDNSTGFSGFEAVKHSFATASSLDSLVIGEREIITQVRAAYDFSNKHGMLSDALRILMTKTLSCAKYIYTHTNIARNPVSVVSLAFRILKRYQIGLNERVIVVGAGDTNTKMCKFLHKHGIHQFTVFNRTFEKAQTLAEQIGGKAYPLNELPNFKEGFDILLVCTGAENPTVSLDTYQTLLNGDKKKKIVVDLGIPKDLADNVLEENLVKYIEIEGLKEIADRNLEERKKELAKCEVIIQKQLEDFAEAFHQRQIEIAMRHVPDRIKEIKSTAFNEVFAKDMASLDEKSRAIVVKMVDYIEKKYISVPMKMAREIMLNKQK